MVGWATGAGLDWAFLPQWSLRIEYLHDDLGSLHRQLTDPASAIVVIPDASFRGDIVRGAVDFRFF